MFKDLKSFNKIKTIVLYFKFYNGINENRREIKPRI